jgi:predicted nucleic acid-binding protein
MLVDRAARHIMDSDVVIWYLRGHAPTRQLLDEVLRRALTCSTLTIYEVWRGVREHERARTGDYLRALDAVAVTSDVAFVAAEYQQSFRARGITLGDVDSVIAATAKVHGLTLLTYNRRHFPMDDIRLFDPMPPLD